MYKEYIVKQGDTLYGIGNQYGVSPKDIINLNNITNNIIVVGQVLKIPNNEGINPDSYITYTVKKGDSLYSLSKIYKTDVNTLIKLNNLSNTNLSIGQKLIIPEVDYTSDIKPNFIRYTVSKGDSLYSISKKYNISIETIILDNSLKNNILSIGQVLNIRSNDNDEVIECFGNNTSNINKTYIVKKGDSLYSISKLFNVSVDSIKKKNNLNSNLLSIGQVLKI